MYQPVLFIGIGEKNHFFTLRESYLHEQVIGGRIEKEVRSFHHFNLSQDPDEAIAKATEAANKMGLPLHTTRAEITEKLDEIKRRGEREMQEAREREERWAREREEAQRAKIECWKAQIAAGYFPDCFRRQTGVTMEFYAADGAPFDTWRKREDILAELRKEAMVVNPAATEREANNYAHDHLDDATYNQYHQRLYPIVHADLGYLNWLMDKQEAGEFEADSLIALAAAKALELCADRRLPRPDRTKHIGMVGERREFKVTVVRTFEYAGYYGITHFVTMVAEDGSCLLSKGAFNPELGERLRIKATIKAHDDYKGQAQTVIQRVKVEAIVPQY